MLMDVEISRDLIRKNKPNCLLRADIGSSEWWQERAIEGLPLQTQLTPLTVRVDFFWRDPHGSASDIASVLIEVNGVTSHRSWTPMSMTRIQGTDVWHSALQIPANWRASYQFLPLLAEQLPQSAKQQGDVSQAAQRRWYRSIMNTACRDPLNLYPPVNGQTSSLHGLAAEPELGFRDWEKGLIDQASHPDIVSWRWRSEHLSNERVLQYFDSAPEHFGDKPIVLLLDGQKWGVHSGLPIVLQQLTNEQVLAPAHYLLIDSINDSIRSRELACHDGFWFCIFAELLPLLQSQFQLPKINSNVLVAGQSLGGLSALFAGLYWPQYVNQVISLSGSYWWPDKRHTLPSDADDYRPQSLLTRLNNGEVCAKHLRAYFSVGLGEPDMHVDNDLMVAALKQHIPVAYEQFPGGHDWLSWRSELVRGLKHLIPATQTALSKE